MFCHSFNLKKEALELLTHYKTNFGWTSSSTKERLFRLFILNSNFHVFTHYWTTTPHMANIDKNIESLFCKLVIGLSCLKCS